jgi:hypothetical protein
MIGVEVMLPAVLLIPVSYPEREAAVRTGTVSMNWPERDVAVSGDQCAI